VRSDWNVSRRNAARDHSGKPVEDDSPWPSLQSISASLPELSGVHRISEDIVSATAQPAFNVSKFRRLPIAVAPRAEQSRIADTLDEVFSDLDAGVATLERVQEKLKLYRASVFKAAVEGALTAGWRVQHPHVEPASELLKRILAERRRHWEEQQLAKFKAKGRNRSRAGSEIQGTRRP